MLILKQSTSIDIRVGPFVDATDGVTPETGITLGAADQAEVLKANGVATVAMAGTFAAITGCGGWYDYTVATGDVDTVGEVVFVVQDSSVSVPVFVRAQVVEEAVYDALYAASAAGPLQSTTAGRTLDVTATGAAGIDWGNVENPTTAVDLSGTDIQLCDTITTYTGNTVQTGDNYSRLGAPAGVSVSADIADVPTVSEFNARTLLASSYFDPAADTVANVTTVATTTTNTDMVAEPTTLLTTQMTESYAADGVAPTLAQALYLIQQTIGDFAISGTTITTKQLDGSTTAATYTLDSSTSPTSRTRAT